MSELKVLSAEDILNADDRKLVEVEVPEWGGKVYVRPMSAEEGSAFVDLTGEERKYGAVKVAAMCLCGADGSPLFTEEQSKKLRGKSLAAFMRLQRVVMKMNGMADEEARAAKNA